MGFKQNRKETMREGKLKEYMTHITKTSR